MRLTSAPAWWEEYLVDLPNMAKGNWKIEKFEVPEMSMERLYFAMQGRPVDPGFYTRLSYNGQVVMSDTPAEIRDHFSIISRASGRVLLHGLGIGMVLKAILRKSEVTAVDVVEKSVEVLEMVRPYYSDRRVTYHLADALTKVWPRGVRWDIVWHDIWDTISEDNLGGMKLLHRRFGRRCDWQGSWGRAWLNRK